MQGEVRAAFHAKMDSLRSELRDMGARIPDDVRTVVAALTCPEAADLAEIRARYEEIDLRSTALDHAASTLIATQQPVAGDLRMILAVLAAAEQIDRSPDLIAHIAEIGQRDHEIPDLPVLTQLGNATASVWEVTLEDLAVNDPDAAGKADAADDLVDELSERLYDVVDSELAGAPTRVLIDMGLTGRYLERIADHAVTIAGRISQTTGQAPVESEQPGKATE